MTIQEWEDKLAPQIAKSANTILGIIEDGDVFVDIGSNTGLLTKLVVVGCENQGVKLSKIIMFEPIKQYYNECVKKFGNDDRFIINNLALSNDDDDKVILVSEKNFGYNKIYKEGMEIQPHIKQIIKCETFSNWIKKNKISKIDFIKIDAEGHDVEIIYGMFEWIRESGLRPKILFERGWYEDEEMELFNKLKSEFNYELTDYGTDWLLKCK